MTRCAQTPTARWLPFRRERTGAKVQLWCFPHAGGSASIYLPWRPELGAAVDICSLEPPGRGTRAAEPLFLRMDPLVDALVDEVAPAMTPPFAFFGHSMGATVAFELARRLEAIGAPTPVLLFASAARAPHIADPDASQNPPPDDAVLETVRTLGGAPAEVLDDPFMRDQLLPVWRADFGLHIAYVHRRGAPLSCPITAFGGTSDPRVPTHAVEAWRQHTRSRFRCRLLSGGHFFLRPRQRELLDEIARDLAPWTA